jgi:integrase
MKKTEKNLWTKTNTPNLYQHRNRRYYARLFVGGKEIWKSLKTKLKSVAVERLHEHVVNVRQQRSSGIRMTGGTLNFGEILELYRQNFSRDAEMADGTKNFREAGVRRLLKTWPGVETLNVRKISSPMVRAWTLRLRTEATPYVPNGAKTPCRNSTGASPTTFNCALDALRQALDLAVETGHLFTNPARDRSIKRVTPKSRRLVLPSRQQFIDVVEAVDRAGYGECRAAAEMVKLLAFTGARQNEANHLEWRDVNFETGRITLRVTKNGEPRDVPMIPECRGLLEAMRLHREDEPGDKPVLRVRECRGFLTMACQKVGAPRIGHHGLRHLFATTAIEAGIDVPTVAKIMGHRDGGALAMKVYGHLRDEHAQSAMLKVSFNCGAKPDNLVPFVEHAG